MNINFTLVVQAVHFLIAYQLIDRFLLRKVITLVQEDENAINQALEKLSKAEDQLHKKESYKNSQWHTFCIFFQQASPTINTPTYREKSIKGIETIKTLTKQQEDFLTTKLTKAIMSGVCNGV